MKKPKLYLTVLTSNEVELVGCYAVLAEKAPEERLNPILRHIEGLGLVVRVGIKKGEVQHCKSLDWVVHYVHADSDVMLDLNTRPHQYSAFTKVPHPPWRKEEKDAANR